MEDKAIVTIEGVEYVKKETAVREYALHLLVSALTDDKKTPEELMALASVGNAIANICNTFN